jgi:hypothetical protein
VSNASFLRVANIDSTNHGSGFEVRLPALVPTRAHPRRPSGAIYETRTRCRLYSRVWRGNEVGIDLVVGVRALVYRRALSRRFARPFLCSRSGAGEWLR